MPFTVTANDENGHCSVSAPTPRDALDAYLKFYRKNFKDLAVYDDRGYELSLDQLSSLCGAAED